MNFFRKVYKVFIEGWKSRKTFLYKDNYEAMKNGTTHTGFPEIDKYFHVIEKCIEEPNEVKQDSVKKNRKCYYSWFVGDNIYKKNMHMKVVMQERRNTCEVITAFFTSNLKKEEATLWSQT